MKHLLILITCVVLVFSNIKTTNAQTPLFKGMTPVSGTKEIYNNAKSPTKQQLTIYQFKDIWLENPYLCV